jgi:hypothetical protein
MMHGLTNFKKENRFMVAKPERKRQLERFRRRCKCNFKIDSTGMKRSELD